MRRSIRSAVAFLVLGWLSATAASAVESDFGAPESTGPTRFDFVCTDEKPWTELPACRDGTLPRLAAEIDAAAARVFAKASPQVLPLLKRDQAWAREWLSLFAGGLGAPGEEPEGWQKLLDAMQRRLTVLQRMEPRGKRSVAGEWVNAFGTAALTRMDDKSYRIEVATYSSYGGYEDEKTLKCHAQAVLKPAANGWFAGMVITDPEPFTETPRGNREAVVLRARLQGGSLRIVVSEKWDDSSAHLNCTSNDQVTGTYFAAGDGESGHSQFVSPSFDCANPNSASEEEICADPELAANDLRLNKAWKSLLPRLDPESRKLLTQDQRNYIKTQNAQYSVFLHPGWDKPRGEAHQTGNGREELHHLQRERIAMLEGFDEKRSGLEGLWLAYNALVNVERERDGKLKAAGWKWEQGDWKMRCEYEMTGVVTGGVFRSDQPRPNPDTLEREHASLLVNRADDEWAKTRGRRYGSAKEDEQKCTRRLDNSSTARLFPVRPSPDIDTKESIR